MTDPYGVIDLAALKNSPESSGGGEEPSAHEITVTEQGLEQIIADSQSIATLLVVTSSRVPDGEQFLSDLRQGIDQRHGAVRLALVDADSQPRVAGALRVQALPTILLLVKGQVQPIAEAALPAAEITNLLDQVVQLARQQGLTVPEGADGPEGDEKAEPEELPPLVAEAMGKVEQGDFDGAISAFEKHLQQQPADVEAKAGLATVRLMQRTQGADLQTARDHAAQNPGDLEAQLAAADMDMLGGHVADAFDRLLDQLRGADPDTKDTVRARILELFDVAGPGDPRVAAARKRLANLLF